MSGGTSQVADIGMGETIVAMALAKVAGVTVDQGKGFASLSQNDLRKVAAVTVAANTDQLLGTAIQLNRKLDTVTQADLSAFGELIGKVSGNIASQVTTKASDIMAKDARLDASAVAAAVMQQMVINLGINLANGTTISDTSSPTDILNAVNAIITDSCGTIDPKTVKDVSETIKNDQQDIFLGRTFPPLILPGFGGGPAPSHTVGTGSSTTIGH